MPGVTPPFDPIAHHRERTRKAETRADTLEHLNAQLYRLLAITIVVAARQAELDPLHLLSTIEDMDRIAA